MQTDKQMAGKWVDGQKGKESSSQTDRKTDGELAGRQTDTMTNGMQPVRRIWKLEEGRTKSPTNVLSFLFRPDYSLH